MTISELRKLLERKKFEKDAVQNSIAENRQKIASLRSNLKRQEQAQEIIRKVAVDTQNQLQIKINDITSLAMEAVFPNPKKLEIEFVVRRGSTECDIFFIDADGNKMPDLLEENAGGELDIASFAFRIVSYILQSGSIRNTIILDEPFKNLSVEFVDNASRMLKEISEKLDIQFIIVTHNQNLASYADKVYKVIKRNKISKIKTPQ